MPDLVRIPGGGRSVEGHPRGQGLGEVAAGGFPIQGPVVQVAEFNGEGHQGAGPGLAAA